jgi:hypothetical protein
MQHGPIAPRSEEQAAVDLIDRNVSFDFKSFLGKVGPAPRVANQTGPTTQSLVSKQELPGSGNVRKACAK